MLILVYPWAVSYYHGEKGKDDIRNRHTMTLGTRREDSLGEDRPHSNHRQQINLPLYHLLVMQQYLLKFINPKAGKSEMKTQISCLLNKY